MLIITEPFCGASGNVKDKLKLTGILVVPRTPVAGLINIGVIVTPSKVKSATIALAGALPILSVY